MNIFVICIVIPLLIFDGQLLFNYGLFSKRHMCDEPITYESKQFQRSLHHPYNNTKFLTNIPIRYHASFFQIQTIQPKKCAICILWNIIDTFLYAIIPFVLILISSIIIILKICERRRTTEISGGIRHTNQRRIIAQDNLSFLLISINCLFLIMTGPFNICLIIQSIAKYFYSKKISITLILQLNQYLRLLQNSYHAFTFLFYCVAGNKFRQSAFNICILIYQKILQILYGYSSKDPSTNSCCSERRYVTSHKPTASSTSNDILKRSPKLNHKTFLLTENRIQLINKPL